MLPFTIALPRRRRAFTVIRKQADTDVGIVIVRKFRFLGTVVSKKPERAR